MFYAQRFHGIMRVVSQKLNLKEHKVLEMSTKTEKSIAGPVDIEGHLGLDGRYYILDTGHSLSSSCRIHSQFP